MGAPNSGCGAQPDELRAYQPSAHGRHRDAMRAARSQAGPGPTVPGPPCVAGGVNRSYGRGMQRRIVVTGANKGIGFALVEAILDEADDTFVFLGARSVERGRAAAEKLASAQPTWRDRVHVLQLDVTSDASVARAADEVRSRCPDDAHPLYGVVNNAGMGGRGADLRTVLEVNTLGIRRVCESFVPLLAPSGGRVVNITSAAGPNFVARCSPERQRFLLDRTLEWPQLASFVDECLGIAERGGDFAAEGLGDGEAYGLSKACSNTLTRILAREHPALRINACTPGFIETDMTRPHAEAKGVAPSELGMKPPAEGTRSARFLLFGEPEGSGHYYGSDAQRSPLDRYRAPGTPAYTGA